MVREQSTVCGVEAFEHDSFAGVLDAVGETL